MYFKMTILVIASCMLATLLTENGWLLWLSAGAAFVVVDRIKKVLGD